MAERSFAAEVEQLRAEPGSVFHGEGTFCCRGGEQILGAAYNPPISPEYLELISGHGFSANSRFLNNRLSFAAPLTM